ncbi:MAG: hypothetical protein M1814_003008 [Vezdaea aestivalis]|nr:MAG: hypothetical protein M1814_003008 [Vezdaea aestivalis]
MADQLCGPSNPLQSFQKQALDERQLHQDRARPGLNTPQGFRSTARQAGDLDHEVQAFRTNNIAPLKLDYFPPLLDDTTTRYPLQTQPTTSAENWAADFQSAFASPQQAPAQIVGHSLFSQQTERQQRTGISIRQAQNAIIDRENRLHAARSHAILNQPERIRSIQCEDEYGKPYEIFEQLDDQGRWQDMFEEVDSFAQQVQEKGFAQSHVPEPSSSLEQAEATLAQMSISEQQTQAQTKTADDLSKAAGRIMESVDGDSDAKVQNSEFFAFMRKLRDREVVLRDDKFVESEAIP